MLESRPTTTSANLPPHLKGPIPQKPAPAVTPELSIFSFLDYREYLKVFFERKKSLNSNYSQSAFVRKAGLGKNFRGYLKVVMDGKRNLTQNTLRGFSEALGLGAKESLYFENLVFFNQAKNTKDKEYYFQRMSGAATGKDARPFELHRSRNEYCKTWYFVAVRELVALGDFREDPAWIATRLRSKITRAQAQEAIETLLKLDLIKRDETGKLVQSNPLIKINGGTFNYIMHHFHLQMIDRAKESLEEDEYEERNASGVTISCSRDQLPEMKRMIDEFRNQMNVKFGAPTKAPDTVFQLNLQIFQLTAPKSTKAKGESREEV